MAGGWWGGAVLGAVQPSRGDDIGVNPLLERADQLSALEAHLAAVLQSTRGRMVLIGGEVGVGKTALVRHFCSRHTRSVRFLTGACDALFTPRPLGPLLDIAPFIGGEFQALAERGGRPNETAASAARGLSHAPPYRVAPTSHLHIVRWPFGALTAP